MAGSAFKPFAAALMIIALAGAVSAVSSAEALDKAKVYIGDAIKDVTTLEQPLEQMDNRYYAFYFPITSQSKLFLAVDELDGIVITDSELLNSLASQVYGLEVARRVLKAQGLGYVDLDSFSNDAKRKVESTGGTFDSAVKGQLEPRYPGISFSSIEQKLEAISLAAEALGQQVSEGMSLERAFESSYSSQDLGPYLEGYNRTLAALSTYLSAAEDYQQAVRSKGNEVVNSKTLTLTQRQEITNALNQVFDVGAWESYRSKYVSAREEYDRRNARSAEWVNSSIGAFYYIKAKQDADAAYTEQQQRVALLLGSEFELRACALETEYGQLKAAWSEINTLRQRGDRASYESVVAKVPNAAALADTLEDKYNTCIKGATPTPAPKQTGTDWTLVLAVLAVAAIGGFAYWQYRKKQMEEEG